MFDRHGGVEAQSRAQNAGVEAWPFEECNLGSDETEALQIKNVGVR